VMQFDGRKIVHMTKIWHSGLALKDPGWIQQKDWQAALAPDQRSAPCYSRSNTIPDAML